MSETPTLTIALTSEQVDALIFALASSQGWIWATNDPQHYATRRELLERLRAWVDPSEMTAEEILKREG